MCENKDDDDDDDDDVSICSSCTDEHVAETARDDDVFKRLQRRRPSAWPDLICLRRGRVKLTSFDTKSI